ncbi:putative leucine-rich repeat-containing protein DDB_G0290503 isoform X2 [Macadamia integrifolia]|nr:putative leucine-rich repeat-containing protein DDB_G0290503 isoform X2 [Macadamia integrifolia]XP_042504099.1 putative leucine-rich repeat-containing protein DDB_G0290503 isoform X2 [Macadamia integrifolia]
MPSGSKGFDGNDGGIGSAERSAESEDTPDPGLLSGDGLSSSVEISEGVDAGGYSVKSSESQHNVIAQMPASPEEERSALTEHASDTQQVGVSETASANGNEIPVEDESSRGEGFTPETEQITVVDKGSPADQESRHLEVDDVDDNNRILVNPEDIMQDTQDEGNLNEDAGKEDMFVDASDELTVSSARSMDEPVTAVETQGSPLKKLDIHESPFQVVEDLGEVNPLMDELARLQALLDKVAGEKEVMEQQYKDERELFTRELANIHHQLEGLTCQHPLLDDNNRADMGDSEDMPQVSNSPLQLIVGDCSKFILFLKGALDERLRTEGTMRELQAILFKKDQEIEDLNATSTELSVSLDIVFSYLGSLRNTWLQSLKQQSEVQLERDQHVENVMNGLVASLSTVLQEDDLSDDSLDGKISCVEKGMVVMIENNNRFLFEINQLKQCLAEVNLDVGIPEEKEFGAIFGVTRAALLESKRKEIDFLEKLNQIENENKTFLEQISKEKEKFEEFNAEVIKIKTEFEQEKFRYNTTKEKLTMAVTKGKALVQQRDSLKQTLAEKTSELENCSLQLQEKSIALEAAEASIEEFVKSQNLVASLEESLSQREMLLKEIQEALSQIDMPEGLQPLDSVDVIRWLLDRRNILECVSMEFHRLKDAFSSIDLPETISSDLESQVNWLWESFSKAKDDIMKLQDEIAKTQGLISARDSELLEAHNEIDRLTESLSAEKQEKDSLQVGLDNLMQKYEGIVEKVYRVSSEKDQMMRIIQSASGIIIDNHGTTNEPSSDMVLIIENCIAKIREQVNASFESSHVEVGKFEMIQGLLYVRDQELTLCEKILEEEPDRSEMTKLSNEITRASQEIAALKGERDSLQKDLQRSDERTSLLKEKLSTAVKKGKGLVQDQKGLKHSVQEKDTEIKKLKLELQQQDNALRDYRDKINILSGDIEHISELESDLGAMKDLRDQLEKEMEGLKHSLHEKDSEIEKLKLELQQQEYAVRDCRDQIGSLSGDLKCIPALESDLGAMKDQRDQLEKFLGESNNMLQRVIESMDDVVLPVDAAFEEPVEKVKCLAKHFHEYQVDKTCLEQELEKLKEEASSLGSKFAEADTTITLLKDALSQAEKNVSLLSEEKKDLEARKIDMEQELRRAIEEASNQASKFAEACATINSMEDALSMTENAKTSAEIELEKVKEEALSQASKLAEANITIRSLENALSEVEKNVPTLAEEKDSAEYGRACLEKELEKVKKEGASQASKLSEAYTTLNSLQDALSQAESNYSVIVDEKKTAEQEVLTLNDKLTACMEELAGTHGSLESRSSQLLYQVNNLQAFMEDDSLLSSLTKGFKKKFESLEDMTHVLGEIHDQLVAKCIEFQHLPPGNEKDPYVAKLSSTILDSMPNGTLFNSETRTVDLENIPTCLAKAVEGFSMKNKLLEDKFEGFSSSLDELIAFLISSLRATKDDVIVMLERMDSLNEKVRDLEAHKESQESVITTLENEIAILLSTCRDATNQLQFDNNLLDLSSIPELEKLYHDLYLDSRQGGGDAVHKQQEGVDGTEYVESENLLLAARKIQNQTRQFKNMKNVLLKTIEDLQKGLKETTLAFENAMQERDLNHDKASRLENDLESLQNYCSEMQHKLKDYKAKEELRGKESELSSRNCALTMTGEADAHLFPEDQLKTLFEKVNRMEIPFKCSEQENPQLHGSDHVNKLFSIIDGVAESQQQINLLYHEKEELRSSLEAQVHENDNLKKEAVNHFSNNQESEKLKTELTEIALSLEKFIQKLGGNDLVEDKKLIGARGLLQVLEKLVMTIIVDSESSKTKAQELSAKLLGSQKVADELSNKVKLLEDAIHGRPAMPETVQERSIYEAPSTANASEISEIEDVGSLGKKSISPVSSATHVRTMRKGSSDHLALNIDSESDHLVNHLEPDDDKGHVFKSLNTSGLIPKQGKIIADRIDGIWVSGGRVLMSRPRARLGLIAYWILLQIWFLGTIL